MYTVYTPLKLITTYKDWDEYTPIKLN
jgi:hypothetical protein